MDDNDDVGIPKSVGIIFGFQSSIGSVSKLLVSG